jgi:hypothetical protein
MNDLHKKDLLTGWYKDALLKAEEYLKNERYVYGECNYLDADYPKNNEWSVVWHINFEFDSKPSQLMIALPKTFPDEFPKVYIPCEMHSKIYPIPHLDQNRYLCTFDPVECSPNPDKPGEIIAEVIKRAKKLIADGISGNNVSDYKDEFLAYWNLDCDGKILSLFAPSDESCYLKLIFFSKTWGKFLGIISKETEDAKNWCEALRISCDKSDICDVLYLPLLDFGYPPFPSTISELYKRLDKYDKSALNKLEAFLMKENSKYFVAFSSITDAGRVL